MFNKNELNYTFTFIHLTKETPAQYTAVKRQDSLHCRAFAHSVSNLAFFLLLLTFFLRFAPFCLRLCLSSFAHIIANLGVTYQGENQRTARQVTQQGWNSKGQRNAVQGTLPLNTR